ncbi:MAG: ABC transporter permease [Planctomycetota bacterium]|nr:ABC transporter permease [Planctomycetota bacterium]
MTNLPPPLPTLPPPPAINWGSLLNTFGALLALAAIYILFMIIGDSSFRNVGDKLEDIVRATTQVGFAALGMTVIIIIGGIDLSVGSVLGLTSVVVALLLRDAGFSPLAAACGAVAAGALCGALNGLLIVGLRVVPFIITLGMMLVARGAAIQLGDKGKVNAPPQWLFELVSPGEATLAWSRPVMTILVVCWCLVGVAALLAGASVVARAWRRNPLLALVAGLAWLAAAGVIAKATYTWPAGLWMLAAAAILVTGMLRYTRFGRHVFAVGSNEQTARLCGVRVGAVKIAAFALGGLFAGLAGLMNFARVTVGDCKAGDGQELNVIAAVVIGGGSLAGGEGSVLGSLVGAMIMSVIATGCTSIGVESGVQMIITGGIIVVAVFLDRLRHQNAR